MIVEKIGVPAMYEMLAEECCELAHAALKMARIIRGENPTPKTREEVEKNLVEEVTDVRLCLKELDISYDNSIMAHKADRFRQRWKKRINISLDDDLADIAKKIREAGE